MAVTTNPRFTGVSQFDDPASVGVWRPFSPPGAPTAAHTGTTDETVLSTVTIPAGTLGANGMLRVTVLATVTDSTNDKTLAIKFGADTYATAVEATSGTTVVRLACEIKNDNATDAQLGWTSGATDFVVGDEETAADVDLTVTGTLELDSESIVIEAVVVEVMRS